RSCFVRCSESLKAGTQRKQRKQSYTAQPSRNQKGVEHRVSRGSRGTQSKKRLARSAAPSPKGSDSIAGGAAPGRGADHLHPTPKGSPYRRTDPAAPKSSRLAKKWTGSSAEKSCVCAATGSSGVLGCPRFE